MYDGGGDVGEAIVTSPWSLNKSAIYLGGIRVLWLATQRQVPSRRIQVSV
jgi:hypothetical protein